jgi:hypothetical protein
MQNLLPTLVLGFNLKDNIMYKGNMGDFVQKVNDYLKRKHDCLLSFSYVVLPAPVDGSGLEPDSYYCVAFFAPGQKMAYGYKVFDREDFEQQIYDYVNEELSNVQGEYDGFSEPPEDIFGEEVYGFEDEDN